ncbi:squalene cyclase [Timonella sp. A28]|uniref:squalene cyclase n=1 Tax=Timonella sp. A28 TaxID=3442640 RepID=UPI003EB6DCAD
MALSQDMLAWLLDTDPTLKWQVERDLQNAPPHIWQTTRARINTEGHGKRLLDAQDDDGQWAGGAFFPHDFDFEGPEAHPHAGQPYTATSWTLNTLREWGLPAENLAGTVEKLQANSRWEYNNARYWDGEVDVCINASTLANGAWLGTDMSHLAHWFIKHSMDEGGWNCEWVEGSTRASYHSTLNALIGLLEYESYTGDTRTFEVRKAGEEYLLKRHLLYRLTTGDYVSPWVSHFTYPMRWQYNALRAADYFMKSALHDDEEHDPRLSEAIDLIEHAQNSSGRWIQNTPYPGRVWFNVDVPENEESPWLTFYATRILNWWHTQK